MPTPPPLPTSLSSRLQSSIDPTTGTCRHHPQVKLCELVQNNTRWVVRRKICYKCGTRSNGKHHRPGVAVKTADRASSSRERRPSVVNARTRSVSVSRRGSVQERSRSLSRERVRAGAALGSSEEQPSRRSRSRLSSRDFDVKVSAPPPAAPAPAPQPVVQPPAVQPPAVQTKEEDFDESDPIIYIPSLLPHEELPPPPPRTEEEAERHADRLEMRRVHDKKKNAEKKEKVRASAPEKREVQVKAESAVLPSANAMALLETHGKVTKHKQPTTGAAANNNDEEASETSSISTASAKMYQLEPDELRLHHPELEGVDPPHHLVSRDPPKEIIPSKSRSLSRGRVKKSVDPEECMEMVVFDEKKKKQTAPTAAAATSGAVTVGEKTRAKSVDRRHRRTTVEHRPKSVMGNPNPSSKSIHNTSKSLDPRSRTRRKSVPHAEIKTLSASAARMSRSRTPNRNTRTNTKPSRSKSRDARNMQSSRSLAARSRKSTRTDVSTSRRSHSTNTRKNASGTACTQPLSVSSDEKKDDKKVEVVYKKRARRKSEAVSVAKSMPVAHIDVSGDEKSHASSISSSSTIEESFTYSEDNVEEKKGGAAAVSTRGSMLMKDVKGGAVGLANRGRSTLIGLKGTSKKWQSALFM